MKKDRTPFDYHKFFLLLGWMGAMLVVVVLSIIIMMILYGWVGTWGVAVFLLLLFVLSRWLVQRYVPRMLAARAGEPSASQTVADRPGEKDAGAREVQHGGAEDTEKTL